MIVLAVIKDENRVGERGRGVGKPIHHQVAIAIDNFNLMIAERSNESQYFGKVFSDRFERILNFLASEYEITQTTSLPLLRSGLQVLFPDTALADLSVKQIDEVLKVGARGTDSMGKLEMYLDLRSRGIGGGDEAEDDSEE